MRQRRYEFSKETKLLAWERSGGRCECGCGEKIYGGNGPDYHHRYLPATEPGSNTLDNCQVLRRTPCHRLVTDEETTPTRAKSKRVHAKHINARDKKRGFRKPPPGYNAWTRQIDH
jgi:hypothetical protein